MPPPPAVTMQQQQQQAKGSSSTPSRAEYGSYSAYPSQHSVSGPPPSSSSVSQSPLQSAASASLPLAASQQQRMRPPAPAYDPRMAAPTQHQTHQQHQQQAQQQYADGAAGHSASLAGSGSVGLSSGVSASMALMANIYEDLVHELVLDTCYGVHKQEKTASFTSDSATPTPHTAHLIHATTCRCGMTGECAGAAQCRWLTGCVLQSQTSCRLRWR